MNTSRVTTIASFFAVTGTIVALYALLGLFSTLAATSSLGVPLLWLPAGLAVAAMVTLDRRLAIPGIWIGALFAGLSAFLADGFQLIDLVAAAAIATSALAQALVAGLLQQRFALFLPDFNRRGWALVRLSLNLLLAASAVGMIDASIGAASLALSGQLSPAAYWAAWSGAWLGNTLGILILAPALLWSGSKLRSNTLPQQTILLVIDIGLILSIGLFFLLWSQESERITFEFKGDAATAALVLGTIVNDAHDNLEVIQTTYIVLDRMATRSEFQSMTQMHLLDPGVVSLSWAPIIPAAGRTAYEVSVQQEGFPDFMIAEPGSNGSFVRAAERTDYVVVQYTESRSAKSSTKGLDLNSDPILRAALQQSRDSGQPRVTAPFSTSSDRSAIVMMFWPVYTSHANINTLAGRRAAIQGYLIGTFDIHDMLTQAMQSPEFLDIDVYLLDQQTDGVAVPIHSHLAVASVGAELLTSDQWLDQLPMRLSYSTAYAVGGRDWRFIAMPTAAFIGQRRTWLPFTALLAGLVLTGLAAYVLSKRLEDAEILQRNEMRFRVLIEKSANSIALMSSEGNLLYISPNYAAQLGDPLLNSIGSSFLDFIHPDDVALVQGRMQAVLQDPSMNCTTAFRMRHYDGSWHWMECTATNLLADSVVGALVANMLDITERKQREEQIAQLNNDLERRVEQRTAELSLVNGELNRALHAKDEFLAIMSHELRTPLSSILAFSELLIAQEAGPLTERQVRSIQYIDSSGQHLLSLINDILDLSKIEAGRMGMHLEIGSIANICQASMRFVKQIAIKQGLRLNFTCNDELAMMEVDAKRLKQMLVNLLSNAVKFTPTGGHVSLDVVADDEQHVVRFIVTDTGIGIAAEDIGRLFTPFTQLDSGLTRQYQGTGLGLALVKRLAGELDGTVQIESAGLGSGSRFTLTLPWRTLPSIDTTLLPAQASTILAQNQPPAGVQSLHEPEGALILLAEDNEATISVLSDYLLNRHYRLVVASNGMEALTLAAETKPDLILMDIQMPVMDGISAIRSLRTQPAFAATPIIALTGLAMAGDRERCLAAGANEYLSKPVSLRALAQIIAQLLASVR